MSEQMYDERGGTDEAGFEVPFSEPGRFVVPFRPGTSARLDFAGAIEQCSSSSHSGHEDNYGDNAAGLESSHQKTDASRSKATPMGGCFLFGCLRWNRRSILHTGAFLVTLITIAVVSLTIGLSTRKPRDERREDSQQLLNHTSICEERTPAGLQDITVYLELDGMTSVTSDQQDAVGRSLRNAYNLETGGCADKYERWMVSALVNQFGLVNSRGEQAGTNGGIHLLVEIEATISCLDCPAEEAFASVFPSSTSKTDDRTRRHLLLYSRASDETGEQQEINARLDDVETTAATAITGSTRHHRKRTSRIKGGNRIKGVLRPPSLFQGNRMLKGQQTIDSSAVLQTTESLLMEQRSVGEFPPSFNGIARASIESRKGGSKMSVMSKKGSGGSKSKLGSKSSSSSSDDVACADSGKGGKGGKGGTSKNKLGKGGSQSSPSLTSSNAPSSSQAPSCSSQPSQSVVPSPAPSDICIGDDCPSVAPTAVPSQVPSASPSLSSYPSYTEFSSADNSVPSQGPSSMPSNMPSPTTDTPIPSQMPSPTTDTPSQMPSPAADTSSPSQMPSPPLDTSSPSQMPSPTLDTSSPSQMPSPTTDTPSQMPSPTLDTSSPTSPTADTSSPSQLPSPTLDTSSPSQLPSPATDTSSPSQLPSPTTDTSSPSQLPSLTTDTPSEMPSPTTDTPSQIPTPTSDTPSQMPSPTTDTPSQIPTPTTATPTQMPSLTTSTPSQMPFSTTNTPSQMPSPADATPSPYASPACFQPDPIPATSTFQICLEFIDARPVDKPALNDVVAYWESVIVSSPLLSSSSTSAAFFSSFCGGNDQNAFQFEQNTYRGIYICGFYGPTNGPVLGTGGRVFFGPNINDLTVSQFGSLQITQLSLDQNPTSSVDPAVLQHEIGHALGIGTAWSRSNQPLVQPAPATDATGNFCNYVGMNALNAFLDISGAAANPLDASCVRDLQTQRFGSGAGATCGGHWEETCLNTELMTPTLNGAASLSSVSVGSLEDIGYTVNTGAPQINFDPDQIAGSCKCPPVTRRIQESSQMVIAFSSGATKAMLEARAYGLIELRSIKVADPDSPDAVGLAVLYAFDGNIKDAIVTTSDLE